jgi:adenosylcobyric acid synthase
MTCLVAGTASGVGKNTVACGLIRLLRTCGRSPIPFKAISFESLPLESGEHITPCIQVQAISAGIEPNFALNPVRAIFCPETGRSTVYVRGNRVNGSRPSLEDMSKEINCCFREAMKLGEVVMEGSGGLSDYYESPLLYPVVDSYVSSIVLVADAYNGGALASIVGTLELAPRHWLQRVRAVIINRFVGSPDEDPIVTWASKLRQRYDIPSLACLPIIHGLCATSEDYWPMQDAVLIEKEIKTIAEVMDSTNSNVFTNLIMDQHF